MMAQIRIYVSIFASHAVKTFSRWSRGLLNFFVFVETSTMDSLFLCKLINRPTWSRTRLAATCDSWINTDFTVDMNCQFKKLRHLESNIFIKPVSIIFSPKIRPALPPTSAKNDVLEYVGVSISIASVSSKNI